MEYSKTLSGALCRIFNEIGPEVFRNPSRLTAYLADFAPNLKAERMQMQMFVDSGCAKQLAVATSADIKQRIAAAVDTLSKLYGMDSKKAEELCNIYVSAMSGREYDAAKSFPDAKMQPVKEEEQFRLRIEDVFQIAGRGMVAVGRVRGGAVHVGDPVVILRANGGKQAATVVALEQYHQLQDSVAPGGAVGILLSDTRPGDVRPGDLLIALPGAAGDLKDIQIPQFRMRVDGFFTIEGRGPVVTGWVHGARIRVGNPVAIVRADGTQRTATVRGIEHNQQLLDCAHPGDAVGILLFGVHETEVGVGDWLVYFDW